jgi:dTMP kinase
MSPPQRERGKLISFEGIDGVGKSTAILGAEGIEGVDRHLRALGLEVLTLREPGGTLIGERIRSLLKDPSLARGASAMHPKTEALLFAAARAQIAEEVIKPALLRGAWVIVDRFVHSSIAYQGYGRGLGDEVADVSRFALGGLWPDRVLLLELSDDEATSRRGSRLIIGEPEVDRIEMDGASFQTRVAEGYRRAQRLEGDLIHPVSANGTPREVIRRCLASLMTLLGADREQRLAEMLVAEESQ